MYFCNQNDKNQNQLKHQTTWDPIKYQHISVKMEKIGFWKWFTIVAGIASIISLFCLFFDDKTNGIIALCAFILFLISIIVLLFVAINKLIKTDYPQDYKKIIVFASYETQDGIRGVFEVFKVIQSKRIALQQIEHNFKWTGSKSPSISSDLQDIKTVIKSNSDDYDKAVLALRKPLSYNDSGTIHFKAATDDVDGTAQPHLDHKVETEMNVIHFRVTLKYKDNNYSMPAKLLKKPIANNSPVNYKQFASVSFDKETKSYQYSILNPEVGFFYRIEWEK